jgi:neutral ceramidase
MTGKPLAAIIDLPVHGIVGDENNPLATADVPGAIEHALTAELGIPVLHFQGAAGDINPSGDTGRVACPDLSRCLDLPRLEELGARATALVAPLITGIVTSDQAAMEVVTQTFPIRRAQQVDRPDGMVLEYAPVDLARTPSSVLVNGEGWAISPITQFQTNDGAGLCGSACPLFDPLPGPSIGPYSSCVDLTSARDAIWSAFDVNDDSPLPLCDTLRATTTSVRFSGLASGDWLVMTAPGEPCAPYAAYLRNRSPAGTDHTLLIGYSDDHVGYLLTAEDWLAGGYEPSINIWGPLEGEMTIDGILAAAAVAWTPEREDPELGSSRYVDWTFPPIATVPEYTTTNHGQAAAASPDLHWPDTAGPVTLAPGASIPRVVGAARFVWYGGDPAVDLPEVIIERESTPDVFVPLVDAHGRQASSRWGAAQITYAPEPLTAVAPTSHLYGVVWQPVPSDPYSLSAPTAPYGLPLGRYRFHVYGNALAASGKVTYDLPSAPFTIVAAPLAAMSAATRTATGIAVQALLGTAPGLRALRDAASDSGVTLPGPWTVTVSFSTAPAQAAMVTPDAMGNGAVPLDATLLAQAVSVEVRDAAGNGGVLMLP